VAQAIAEGTSGFDAAAWNRQQYTIQRIRTDYGFESYVRSLTNVFDEHTSRDITCGDERILGSRMTLPGCGILQSDAELRASAAAIRRTNLPVGALRRHRQCGAENLSGLSEAEITGRLHHVAKILRIPVGPGCEMLSIDGKVARAAIVAGDPRVNSCAFEGMTPFFCSAISSTLPQDVANYAGLSFAAMPGRFTRHDPFVVAIVGSRAEAHYSLKNLRAAITGEPRIADLLHDGTLVVVGADF